METFGDRLKAARMRKGMMQKDVAALLDCAPTSLTNWELGKIEPSMEVLSRLCEVLEVQPLDLLDRQYSFGDIAKIALKPGHERTYQEKVALNFSGALLEKFLPASKQRKQNEQVLARAAFIQETKLLDRCGGTVDGATIDRVQAEYAANAESNADLLFAFNVLMDDSCRAAVLRVALGLLASFENAGMETASQYTQARIKDYL